MIRVLHIVGKMNRAGVETMLMNLYYHIDRTQIQFDFLVFTAEEGDYDAEIIRLGGRIIPILANNPITRLIKLQKFLRQNPKYRILHAHMLLGNAFHLLASNGAGIENRISHSHSSMTIYSQYNIIRKVYEKLAIIVNNKLSTHKIACSESAAQYLFGTSERVWLLPNAIPIKKIIKGASQYKNYIDQEFNESGIKIIQVGRMAEVKNHNFSIQVADELKRREVDFTMYFIGKGPLTNYLNEQVEKRNLGSNVVFLGLRTDIIELMASADYMIMPSLYEGFPVVLVESQAVGLHALVSNNVSDEVDLNLSLIDFLPISSINCWVERILQNSKSIQSDEERINVLEKRGFNIIDSANKITEFYKNITSPNYL